MAQYTWSHEDKERYDQEREPPRRIWHYHRRTPIIRLSFLPIQWSENWLPLNTRASEFAGRNLGRRQQSLPICDAYTAACMRLGHSRFIVPPDQIPSQLRRGKNQVPLTGLLDQYHVDNDDLIPAVLALLSGKERISLGLCDVAFDVKPVCCFLEDFLQNGLEDFASPEYGED